MLTKNQILAIGKAHAIGFAPMLSHRNGRKVRVSIRKVADFLQVV